MILLVKGRYDEALDAARERGIPVDFISASEGVTTLRAKTEHEDKVRFWFVEPPNEAPFPAGTLLYFFNEEGGIDAELKRVTDELVVDVARDVKIEAAHERRAIIVHGNLSDGFWFEGPFDTWDDAAAHADGMNPLADDTWIATLVAPEKKP